MQSNSELDPQSLIPAFVQGLLDAMDNRWPKFLQEIMDMWDGQIVIENPERAKEVFSNAILALVLKSIANKESLHFSQDVRIFYMRTIDDFERRKKAEEEIERFQLLFDNYFDQPRPTRAKNPVSPVSEEVLKKWTGKYVDHLYVRSPGGEQIPIIGPMYIAFIDHTLSLLAGAWGRFKDTIAKCN